MAADVDPVELLVIYVLDLLAQTEAQHRTVYKAHAELVAYASSAKSALSMDPREQCLVGIRRRVSELTAAIREQQQVLSDMQHTLTRVQQRKT